VTDHLNRPVLGEPDAPCRTCGAPLAADQRYCLQCGTRRAEARLPFLEILKGQGPRGAVTRTTVSSYAAPPAGQVGALGRMSANAVAIAGVACLVLALGVGVLIGNMNDNSAPAAAPAQIIRVGAVGAAPAAATTTAAPATTDTTASDSGASSGRRAAKRRRSSTSSSSSKATNSTVRDLGRSSGSDYAKRSARLPDEVGTGGRLPPKRAGTIGAGSDVESIG
jgi:hypothetical protein